MNYEKILKDALNSKATPFEVSSWIEEQFPELAKSDDEEIRKALINVFATHKDYEKFFGVSVEDIRAWLERQGDYANFRDKAQVGDRITKNENGVLVNLSQLKRVAKPSEKQCEQKFEMKTAEESLGIDSDTYNKIVDECIFGEKKPEENKGNIGGISPNSEWSEEDEQHIDSLLKRLDALCRNKFERTRFAISEDREWLKSLRPQNTWKPSELQLGCLSDAIEHYNSLGYPASKLKELLDDLKKIKEGKV